MIVYKCTHRDNGKSYIGCTTFDLATRIHRHVLTSNRGSKFHFHNAIRKYGIDAFDIEVLAECTSYDEMFETEIRMIDEHDTFTHGYNMTLGGEARTLGIELSDEIKEKISNSLKKANLGGERHYRTGTLRPPCERKKMTLGRRGKLTGKSNHKSRKIIVHKDGISTEYDSVTIAATKLGINNNTMRTLTTSGKFSNKYQLQIEKVQ